VGGDRGRACAIQRRRVGRLRFVLLFGALGWGLPFAALFSLVFPVVIRFFIGDRLSMLEVLVPALPASTAGGVILGWRIWSKAEAEFREARDRRGE